MPLLEVRESGLYCPAGDFYVDPCAPVDRAVITHAHADHVCPGSRHYLTASPGAALLRARAGEEASIESLPYGGRLTIGSAIISFHPAGHILGSAQVRIEHHGEVWVASGDYKLAPDRTCAPFEPVRCHTFVTESTFALPIFRWPSETQIVAGIHDWWRANQAAGKTSLLFAHTLGKAQRLLAALDPSLGPIFCQESIAALNELYRAAGVSLPATAPNPEGPGTLVIAPSLLLGSSWARRFSKASTAMASGWMRIRGTRRRRSLDRGFVLSDHADWPGLLRTIEESGAETVWVTHGFRDPLARWLLDHGRQAVAIETPVAGAQS